eukprot:13018423-Heterocapsa_arctica.AAC.1
MVAGRCEEKRGFELKEDMELEVECDPGHTLMEHAKYRRKCTEKMSWREKLERPSRLRGFRNY